MKTRAWRLSGFTLLWLGLVNPVLADQNSVRASNAQQQQQMQQQRYQQQVQQQQVQQQRYQQQSQQQQLQQQRYQQQVQQQQIQQDRQRQQQVYQDQRQQQQRQQDVYQQQRQTEQRQQQQRRDEQQRQQRLRDDQMQRQLQQRQDQQRRQQDQQSLQQRQGNLPIQPRPNEIIQSEPARPGYYEDIPRRGNSPRPGWGHGDGWGDGPRYRPGYETGRIPGGYSRVPWRGQDYYYSGGYWYRPQGQSYIVVTPPYGARVSHLPSYSREVWYGGTLFFLAAGTYYLYQNDTEDFVVANPPQSVEPVYTPQQQVSSSYDVVPYPAQGQNQAQLERDRYECYRLIVQQSGVDPAAAAAQLAPEVIDGFRQGMAACLQDRGYTIN